MGLGRLGSGGRRPIPWRVLAAWFGARGPVGLFALIVLGSFGACSDRAPSPRVWIVGLDGADWDLLDPMIERGLLPTLARLRREGAWGRLRSEDPMLSPILWTSIATGRRPDVHGVTWFMSEGPGREKIPVTRAERRVRALWDLAHERGLRSGVIGWWATWPVEPIRGWMVSDYVGWHSFGVTGRGVSTKGQFWPADLDPVVRAAFAGAEATAERFVPTLFDAPVPADSSARTRIEGLRDAWVTSEAYLRIAAQQLDRDPPDLFALYLEGTDAVLHLFGAFSPPRSPWLDTASLAAFSPTVERYWQWQDRRLADLLERRPPGTLLVVVSDHGFRVGEERRRETAVDVATADADHLPDGILLLHGPGVRAGQRVRGASLYDVAPTVAWRMGWALSEELPGKPLVSAFEPGSGAGDLPEIVPTWETTPLPVPAWPDAGEGVGAELEDRLRTLGYLAGESSDGSTRASHAGVENQVNRATVLRNEGRLEEAERVLRDVLARDPEHTLARRNLAQVLGDRGDYPTALALYESMLTDAEADASLYEDAAFAAARAGRLVRARAILEEGIERFPGAVRLKATHAFARAEAGEVDEAVRELEAAARDDEREALVHYYRGVVEARRNHTAVALRELRKARTLDPTHEQTVLELAELLRRTGDFDAAARTIEEALETLGPRPSLLAARGVLELRRQRPQAARSWLARALDLRPDDPELIGNLGMAEGMAGDLPAAVARFERVVELQPRSAEAHLQLGMLLAAVGRLEEAAVHMRRARQLDPGIEIPDPGHGGP